ncbi:MAG: cytochrome c oxidase subunit II, partial [Polyangiaceae bacterium]|nr:cytochrome c oxidase subunit II [Polyangiaceae bacterium]
MNDLLRRLLDLPPQASTYARGIDWLHFAVIATTMTGATLVFVVALYFLVRHRQVAPLALTAPTYTPRAFEVGSIAGLLTLFIAFWVIGTIQYDVILSPPPDAMPVYVTAKQWMWEFAYPDGRQSMDELTVPVHRKIKLVMTSRDVIHSFYVPAFRMKHDVVPGRYYAVWFEAAETGVFPVECAEFCGNDHSAMLGRVRVLSARDYDAWLGEKPAPESHTPGVAEGDLTARGRDVAARRGCLNCHTIDGQPHIGPTWVGMYHEPVRLNDGRTIVADDAYLTRSMMDPLAEVVAGYSPVMPTYRGVLPQPEVAALLELMKSLENAPRTRAVRLPPVVVEARPAAAAPPPEE